MEHRVSRKTISFILLFMVIVIICLATFFNLKNKFISKIYTNNDRFDCLINAAAKRHNIDPHLIKAVIWKESAFSESATGTKDEKGLMQLMQRHSVQDYINFYSRKPFLDGLLYEPALNIEIGSWYMAKCVRRWQKYPDNVMMGLAEFNAGYSNVRKWLKEEATIVFVDVIGFPSTKSYCLKIMDKYNEYKKTTAK